MEGLFLSARLTIHKNSLITFYHDTHSKSSEYSRVNRRPHRYCLAVSNKTDMVHMLQILNIKEYVQSVDSGYGSFRHFLTLTCQVIKVLRVIAVEQSIFCVDSRSRVWWSRLFSQSGLEKKSLLIPFAERGRQTTNWLEISQGLRGCNWPEYMIGQMHESRTEELIVLKLKLCWTINTILILKLIVATKSVSSVWHLYLKMNIKMDIHWWATATLKLVLMM